MSNIKFFFVNLASLPLSKCSSTSVLRVARFAKRAFPSPEYILELERSTSATVFFNSLWGYQHRQSNPIHSILLPQTVARKYSWNLCRDPPSFLRLILFQFLGLSRKKKNAPTGSVRPRATHGLMICSLGPGPQEVVLCCVYVGWEMLVVREYVVVLMTRCVSDRGWLGRELNIGG